MVALPSMHLSCLCPEDVLAAVVGDASSAVRRVEGRFDFRMWTHGQCLSHLIALVNPLNDAVVCGMFVVSQISTW